VDEEGHRRCEDSVLLGELPARLEHDREVGTRSLCLAAVLLDAAPAHQQHAEAVVATFAIQPGEIGEERVARAAFGVAEDEEDAPSALLGERDLAAGKIGQLEGWSRRPGPHPLALDATLRQGALAREAPAPAGGLLRQLGNLVGSYRDGLRNPSLF